MEIFFNKNPPVNFIGREKENARQGLPTRRNADGLNHSMRALIGRMRERPSRVGELGSVSIKSDFIR